MITVKPNERVSQHHEDVVRYELALEQWDGDLGPSPRYDKVEIACAADLATRGDFKVDMEKAAPGQKAHVIVVQGGLPGRRYEIVRVVTTKGATPERRRRSFVIKVT